MEKARADVDADIASLRERVAKYRQLAEERRAHGHMMIAEKLTEFVADLKARVAALEGKATAANPVYPVYHDE